MPLSKHAQERARDLLKERAKWFKLGYRAPQESFGGIDLFIQSLNDGDDYMHTYFTQEEIESIYRSA